MKSLVNFIATKFVEKSMIFEHLKCSKAEATILQYLTKKYMKGEDDVLILEILQDLFSSDSYEYLEHLFEIKELLELGWFTSKASPPSRFLKWLL